MENLKPYTAGVVVTFGVDFDVIAESEEQAREKIEHLLEIIRWEGTIDCALPPEYDVHVSSTEVKLEAMYIE